MPLEGDIREIPLIDIIEMLALGNRTGVLYFKGARYAAKIFFKNGRIIFAKSLGEFVEKLGEILKRKGLITPKKLDEVLADLTQDKQHSDKRLGDYLVEKGVLTQDVIVKAVTYQIEETINKILTETMGSFQFKVEEFPSSEDIFIDKSAESILMEAVRRIDEFNKIKQMIGGISRRYIISRNMQRKNIDINLTFEEWKVVINMTGDKSLEQIAQETKVDSFFVAKIAYVLLNLNIIEPAGNIETYGISKNLTLDDINDIKQYLEVLS